MFVRWRVWRGDQKIGTLTSRMAYRDDDDTFEFTTEYRELRFEMAGATATIPHLTTITRVTRSGSLRRQSMAGQVVLSVPRVGELRGDLYRQGREIAHLWTGSLDGFRSNMPFAWGAQPSNGLVFFNDINTGLWITKLGGPRTDTGSTTEPGK